MSTKRTSNPFLGEKVKCSKCSRQGGTRNINGICSRHPEGNRNYGKALEWERAHDLELPDFAGAVQVDHLTDEEVDQVAEIFEKRGL